MHGETEWFEQFILQPDFPIEISLWLTSFQGVAENPVSLPFEVAHIWAYLLEVGPSSSRSMGSIPVSYLEIQAWMQTTKTKLSSWEVVLLHKCSREWVTAYYTAKEPSNIPPWTIEPTDDYRKRVSDSLKRMLGKGQK